MGWFDWVVLGSVFVLLLTMGSVLSKRAGKSTSDFMVAGRRMPWWLVGLSEAATYFNTSSMLYEVRRVRQDGVAGIFSMWSYMIETSVSNVWFMRLWRRARFKTPMEFYHNRYRGWQATFARLYDTLVLGILVSMFWSAIGLVGMKKVAGVMLDIPPQLTILGVTMPSEWVMVFAIGMIALAYSVAAGASGVYWTDFVQFIIAIVSVYILLFIVMKEVGWNVGLREKIYDMGPASRKFLQFGQPFNIAFIYFFIIAPFLNHGGYSPGIQRMLSVRSEKDVVKAELLGSVVNFATRKMPFYLLGIAAFFLISEKMLMDNYPPLTDNQTGQLVADFERIFPALVDQYLPAGLTGLMIAAIFCAFMSSLDTNIHILGSVFVNDLYRPYLRPGRDEKHYVRSTRIAMILACAGTFYLAIVWTDIYMMSTFAISITLATGWVKLMRIIWWRVNGTAEVVAMVFAACWMPLVLSQSGGEYLRELLGTLHLYNPEQPSGNDVFYTSRCIILAVPATLVSLAAVFLTKPEPMDHLVAFYRRMRPWGFWGPVKKAAGVECPDSFFAMAGMSISMIFCMVGASLSVISLGMALWKMLAVTSVVLLLGCIGAPYFLKKLYPNEMGDETGDYDEQNAEAAS